MGTRIFLFVIIALSICGSASAQIDILKLKDSTEVKGKIIYNKPMVYVKIKKLDGVIALYKYTVIESITEGAPNVVTNSGEKFMVVKPFYKSTYQGIELRKMKHVRLCEIMAQDPPTYAQFKRANSIGNFGSVLLITGTLISLFSSSQSAQGATSDYATALNVALGCSFTGLAISIAGTTGKKKAVRNFNNHP